MANVTPSVKMAEVLCGAATNAEHYDKIMQNNNNNNNNNNNMNINKNVIVEDALKIPEHLKYEPQTEYPAVKGTVLQEFYGGSNILITGGTGEPIVYVQYVNTSIFYRNSFYWVAGFLGKMLLYKLLHSCPGIENIFLLVRQKKGKDVHSRVEEIFDDPVSIIFFKKHIVRNSRKFILFFIFFLDD